MVRPVQGYHIHFPNTSEFGDLAGLTCATAFQGDKIFLLKRPYDSVPESIPEDRLQELDQTQLDFARRSYAQINSIISES